MEQTARNFVGESIRRIRVGKAMSQQAVASRCAAFGYDLNRATLAKIEARIRAVSCIELFVIAHVLSVPIPDLYPPGLLKRIRDGAITPYHKRGKRPRARSAASSKRSNPAK